MFAFDPSLELDLQTARINQSVIEVRWEEDLRRGPVGDYIEVVDVDPASRCVYAPVDLNHPHLLAQDGLPPSEGNPQFHQQMVYAVAMKTIANFEQALGRTVHWSPRLPGGRQVERADRARYVQRLRIYPHALREANAYYSPHKKALLFGYFNAQNADSREGLPGGIVFTCLSHDVITHEMTHAILDGIHRRMLEPSNADSLAFHEAFADLVAIFQHFTLPGVLEHQIALTRGDLARDNLLGKLAVEFGRATRHGNALRDVLGDYDPETGKWQRHAADPTLIDRTSEPHARGAILVTALFDSFLAIYKAHTEDLLRIASGGTGILPEGALGSDLVARLADEASKVAQRLLTICIRALDYLPPVDVNFGDYVRALITSDSDLVPHDGRHYRTAIIRACRDWGIYPRDVRTLSVESLRWSRPTAEEQSLLAQLVPPLKGLRLMTYAQEFVGDAIDSRAAADDPAKTVQDLTYELLSAYARSSDNLQAAGRSARQLDESPAGQPARPRRETEWQRGRQFAAYVHRVLSRRAQELAGVDDATKASIHRLLGIDLFDQRRPFEVHAVRPTVRVRQNGQATNELLVLITQQKRVRLASGGDFGDRLSFRFRSGCTLLIDPVSGEVRYTVVKRLNSEGRLARQREFLAGRIQSEGLTARAVYGVRSSGDSSRTLGRQEPLRMVHRGTQPDQWQAAQGEGDPVK